MQPHTHIFKDKLLLTAFDEMVVRHFQSQSVQRSGRMNGFRQAEKQAASLAASEQLQVLN